MIRYLLFIVLFISASAGAVPPALEVQTKGQTTETVILRVPAKGNPNVFTLTNPNRLVIDIPVAKSSPVKGVQLPKKYDGVFIDSVRSGQFNPTTTRIVFDLHAKPGQMKTTSKLNKNQAVITVILSKPLKEVVEEKAVTKPETGLKRIKSEDKDGRPLIVIDAGHGGQDPGASGAAGTKEKEVVLRYAKLLESALKSTKRYRVHMTRRSDHFILLRERVNIARQEKGDIFISLHADSAPEENTNGLSVYTLSEKASDAESAALAERENSADAVYDLDLSDQSKDVADILVSLAQRDTNMRSTRLADDLVIAMREKGVELLGRNTHRFAGFAVLKAPDIPSVLVEIGFISNPKEEKRLQSKAYQAKVTAGLVDGIDAFFAQQQAQADTE